MDAALDLLPLPAAHARALKLLSDPDAEIGALARVIEVDPALTAAMLRAANSAASAPVKRIDTAHEAVIRIGLELTRRLLVGAVASNAFRDLHEAEIDAAETWRHVVATALLAQAAIWHEGDADGGAVAEAFTAGILHDIGRLSMATQAPGRYSLVASRVRSGVGVLEAETEIFGFDHASWGGRVSEVWQVPEAITDAILHHHDGGGGKLARAIFVAREVARSLGIGDGLLAPQDPTFPEQPADEELVAELGGTVGFFDVIDWYRTALDPSPSAAAA
jgi:HD-like signal output (HDOD) protein